MDARNAAAATVFLVALSLSFGYLRVQATGSCSQSRTNISVTTDTEPDPLFCPIPPQSWTIGSDICDVSGFPPYEQCSDHLCIVPSSDYLQRGPTIICCGGNCWEFKIDPVINRVSVPPVIQAGKEVTIYATIAAKPLPSAFPPLIVDVINEPSVSIIDTSMQIVPNPTNDTEYIILHTFVVPLDFDETTKIRPRFSTPPEGWSSLVQLTFEPIGVVFPEVEPPTATDAVATTNTVATTDAVATTDTVATTDAVATTTDPSIATTINPMTTAANVATTSTDTGSNTTMTIAPTTTNIVKDATTMPMTADETTGTTVPGSTTGGVAPATDPVCIAADHLAAAVVVSMAIPMIIVFIALVFVFCCLREKRYLEKRYSEKSYEDKTEIKISEEKMRHQTNGKAALRNGLSLQVNSPANLATQNSITPTSLFGETPADEGTMLLRSSSRNHAANSPAGVVNPGYSRQDSSLCSPHAHGPTLDRNSSRDSNSPTTPGGDTLRPLLKKNNSSDSDDLSAAAAASTKDKRTEPLETSLRDTSDAGASSTGAGARDPHGHTTVDSLDESKNHVYEELNKDGGLRHLPPSLRPLPPPPGSESVRQNTHPPSAAHHPPHLCNHHQRGWDDGGHLPPAPSLEIRVNYPPMTTERLLLGGENSSQCPAPLTHDSCPLDSSVSADLYSPPLRHEGVNMYLAPQLNSAVPGTAV